MSEFVEHAACLACESSDGRAVYKDGTSYCFSCGTYFKKTDEARPRRDPAPTIKAPMEELSFAPFEKEFRGLSKQTLDQYGIHRLADGRLVYFYRNAAGKVIAHKFREPNKKHSWKGDAKGVMPLGAHLANPDRHNAVAICEGELDAPTVTQCMNNKVIGLSVPNGAQNASNFVRKHLDFFQAFEVIYVATDMDEPGQKAAEELVKLFDSGKVRRVFFTEKDANQELTERGGHSVMEAILGAKIIRPDGIKSASTYAGIVNTPPQRVMTRCGFHFWNDKCPFFSNQLIVIIGGSGIGKSTFARALALADMERGIKVGWMGLEETPEEGVFRFAGMAAGIQIHARENYAGLSDNELQAIAQADKFITGSGNLELFDHFGSIETEAILARMSYMVRSLGCKHIYLDHLTIVGSGLGQDTKQLDALVTKLRSFISATRCTVIAISHLNRGSSGHQDMEDGGVPSTHDIRGSHSIVQLADTIWALSRKRTQNTTHSYCLKNRVYGRCGYAGSFVFDEDTQQLEQKWQDPSAPF